MKTYKQIVTELRGRKPKGHPVILVDRIRLAADMKVGISEQQTERQFQVRER